MTLPEPAESVVRVVLARAGEADLSALSASIPASERAELEGSRAGRLSLVGRGVVRTLVAQALDVAPKSLRFDAGPHGKPRLAGSTPGIGPCFNVAHSGELVLVALAIDREVGVDVEVQRHVESATTLARRWLPADDARAIGAAAPGERDAVFLRAWTRHEALLKARGLGVLAASSAPAPLPGAWTVRDLAIDGAVAAAVAAEGSDWSVTTSNWGVTSHR